MRRCVFCGYMLLNVARPYSKCIFRPLKSPRENIVFHRIALTPFDRSRRENCCLAYYEDELYKIEYRDVKSCENRSNIYFISENRILYDFSKELAVTRDLVGFYFLVNVK